MNWRCNRFFGPSDSTLPVDNYSYLFLALLHNQGPWTMPDEFDEYVKHFDEAKALWLRLYGAIGALAAGVTRVSQSPAALVQPANQPWPTQQELRELYQAAEQKSAPLVAEFNRLPQAVQQYAPKPGAEKHRA